MEARLKRKLWTVEIDGCAVGPKDEHGVLIYKPWRIDTTDEHLARRLQGLRCDGRHEHASCAGKTATGSALYPRGLVRRVVASWKDQGKADGPRGRKAVSPKVLKGLHGQYVMIRFPKKDAPRPVGPVEIEHVKKLLLQCHVRSGHIGKFTLKSYADRTGCPPWISELIDELQCDACLEFGDRPGAQPASLL